MSGFERDLYMRVVAMDEAAAKRFAMPEAVKVICGGQADPNEYRFGARVYYLFQTWSDYERYLRTEGRS